MAKCCQNEDNHVTNCDGERHYTFCRICDSDIKEELCPGDCGEKQVVGLED